MAFFKSAETKKKERAGWPDLRKLYDETEFNGERLTNSTVSKRFVVSRILWNLLIQGEVNRRDTRDLLTSILETQREILAELRRQREDKA